MKTLGEAAEKLRQESFADGEAGCVILRLDGSQSGEFSAPALHSLAAIIKEAREDTVCLALCEQLAIDALDARITDPFSVLMTIALSALSYGIVIGIEMEKQD